MKFSSDSIVNRNGVAIATEMNLILTPEQGVNQQQLHEFNTGRTLNQLLDVVKKLAIDSDRSIFNEKHTLIFVNTERASLCDVHGLNQIRELSILLHHLGGNLVVGLTNANPCNRCPRVQQGLLFLKEHDILISANNFNYRDQDFRDSELKSHLYDFVKLTMPNTDDEMDMLVEFIHSELVLNGLKVIVEAVETKTQLKSLNKALIYGYQGRLLKSKKAKTI
ncbi:EAL domain-containing protein [Shewanella sp. YLB-07]|uniref:EAL domain-containing protein n=1 Tax=Shewanella sp. YLB-07 TaxID=2601268 RepID=UPI00128C69DF|nr:EAL domain-containing protein [Shewanella sp. YLB-07]MPY22500.1 EAL domain-containing protein [Shewanella sp. YLB-07]